MKHWYYQNWFVSTIAVLNWWSYSKTYNNFSLQLKVRGLKLWYRNICIITTFYLISSPPFLSLSLFLVSPLLSLFYFSLSYFLSLPLFVLHFVLISSFYCHTPIILIAEIKIFNFLFMCQSRKVRAVLITNLITTQKNNFDSFIK